MQKKSTREIIFDPYNMALTLSSGILLGLLLGFVIISSKNSQYFYQIFLLTGIVFIGIFLILLQYNFDTGMKLKEKLSHFKIIVKKFYSEHTVFSLFNESDWITWFFSIILLIVLGYFFILTFNEYIKEGFSLFNPNLSPEDRQALETGRALLAPLLGLIAATWLFFCNMAFSLFSEVKNRQNFQNVNEKLDTIIANLEKIEKK